MHKMNASSATMKQLKHSPYVLMLVINLKLNDPNLVKALIFCTVCIVICTYLQ